MTNEPNPHEALASIAEARAEVGKTLEYPVAWDFYYGGVVAVMVGGAGLPQPWSTVTLLLSLGALFFMVRWWRARTGWWVNGYAPPRARWVAWGLVAVMMACMGLSFWTRLFDGPMWAPFVGAGVAGVAAMIGGRLWMRAYRRDLMEGQG